MSGVKKSNQEYKGGGKGGAPPWQHVKKRHKDKIGG